MAQLTTATGQEDVTAEQIRCIFLLDFKRRLIRRIHTGSPGAIGYLTELSACTASISASGGGAESSITAGHIVKGARCAGAAGASAPISAFVDDSTLFLAEAEQILHALSIVTEFGALSVLRVQPNKSQLVFLNRAITVKRYEGIEVVAPGDSTRYLGYEIGTGDVENKSWSLRIQKIQRRLLTATRVATSVENRVLILNTIVLPSLLFTASVFDIPIWAEKELHNLFKQFFWAHATSTDARLQTVNPGLLVTPRHAGGIGLVDVTVAVKTQRTKHTLIWLTQRSDKYFAAWRSWALRGLNRAHAWQVTPAMLTQHAATRLRSKPGLELQRTLGNWLSPTPDQLHQLTKWVATHSAGLLDGAVSWWDGDEFVISYSAKFPDLSMGAGDMPAEIRSFWATFNWSENPWIRDQSGNMLAKPILIGLKPVRSNNLSWNVRDQRNLF
uniref:RxLR effector candidate protein n=1 Tax=Hyaloperonospora arabidopsidis (strain Emoy2) TaxID=559515 RepID=M4BM98_HYAAE